MPISAPAIYAYSSTHPDHAGLLKVGYTELNAADRIDEQFPFGLLLKRSGMGRRMEVRRDFV